MTQRTLISIVDDDESVRESLAELLEQLGFAVQAFASADEFLRSPAVGETNCLILDMMMPRMTGAELYDELLRRKVSIPVIFTTAHAQEKIKPLIQHLEHYECLFKPYSYTALRAAIHSALRDAPGGSPFGAAG